jgi:hypothetical protein
MNVPMREPKPLNVWRWVVIYFGVFWVFGATIELMRSDWSAGLLVVNFHGTVSGLTGAAMAAVICTVKNRRLARQNPDGHAMQ